MTSISDIQSIVKGQPVGDSEDLERIVRLPVRPRPEQYELDLAAAWLKEKLGIPTKNCSCTAHFKRLCCANLLPVQTWALVEGATVGGVLGPIGVGHGKTLLDLLMPMVVPNCKVAVLLLPPGLKAQLTQTDWAFYAQHWKLPNLAGGKWLNPGRPLMHVVAFSELSGKKNTGLLERLNPDVLIVDEAHSVAQDSSRTGRYKRFMVEHPDVRVFCWSGTLTKRSIREFAHHSAFALKESSPLPLKWKVIEEWAAALDPASIQAPPGKLVKLTKPGELVSTAFARRLNETPGVVSSADRDSCEASLIIGEREVETPLGVKQQIAKLDEDWERPDGELFVDVLQVAGCARELSCGFYYRWIWPRGEPKALIDRWLQVRRDWNSEVRDKLKRAREGLDSPGLLEDAAKRHLGLLKDDGPKWDSACYAQWSDVRDSCSPSTEAVWIDDFLVRDSAAWLEHNLGICWYEHTAFGEAVEKMSRKKRYGRGKEASEEIGSERGDRSILCSILAHGTGKNLQCFNRNLVANPPSDGAAWEQLLGRTHRGGQLADEVNFEVYRHTAAFVKAVDRARELGDFIQTTLGAPQKLVSKATWKF